MKISVIRDGRFSSPTNNNHDPLSRRRMQFILALILGLSALLFIWIGAVITEEVPTEDSTTGGTRAQQQQHEIEIERIRADESGFGKDESLSTTADQINKDKEETSSTSSSSEGAAESATTKSSSSSASSSSSNSCASLCKATTEEARKEMYGGDILDRASLLEIARKEHANLITKLHKDYGAENFENIFVDKEASTDGEQRYRSKYPVSEDGKSVATLKRKFLIKVLTVQTELAKQKSEASDSGCNCLEDVQYIWATGGHSAAAGHGNMYNESYTAYMEQDLKPIFSALGIEFTGRNYAMGGTASGYEVSMCFEQIFGSDIDFFSWDFGMTDGKGYILLFHYGYRGALNPGHPAFIGFHIGGRSAGGRVNMIKALDNLGLASFHGLSTADSQMYAAAPDSAGKSDEELAAMPEFVRNFKCSDQVEKGDPYCGKEKYTKYACTPRSKQAGWHPGYKTHAIDGHSLALFLVQYLIDALKDLVEHDEKDPEKLLAALKKEDEESHESFVNADIPENVKIFQPKEGEDDYGIDNGMFFKGPSICRTGRLPAQSRYLGYMTNNGKTGGVAPFTKEEYETGISVRQAKESASESNEEMRLVFTEDGKERDNRCTEILKPDYKDYYYSHANDGLTKLVFPNEAEKKAYRYDKSSFKGVLLIFISSCDWGKCQAGDLREDAVEKGDLELSVNGKAVKSFVNVGGGAQMLVGEEGAFWETSSDGDYEIGVRAKPPNSYFRLSGMVLY